MEPLYNTSPFIRGSLILPIKEYNVYNCSLYIKGIFLASLECLLSTGLTVPDCVALWKCGRVLIDKLFSSTDSQGHVTYCHQNKSVVVVHRLLHINLLFWNHWVNCNQTKYECSLYCSLLSLCFLFRLDIYYRNKMPHVLILKRWLLANQYSYFLRKECQIKRNLYLYIYMVLMIFSLNQN